MSLGRKAPILAGLPASAAIVTPWVSEPLTITAVTTNPTKGTIVSDKIWWRRNGDSMEIRIDYEQSTAGTAGSGKYLFKLPGGYTADTSKIRLYAAGFTAVAGIGSGAASDSSSYTRQLIVSLHNNQNIQLGDYVSGFMGSTNMQLGGGGSVSFTAQCTIPIAGWS